MVIGRDIIPIHIIDTYTQFPVSGGGGGGTITLATKMTGGLNNCCQVGFYSPASGAQDYSYSNGVEMGGNSTLGTATSPTRTTQEFDISCSSLLSAHTAAGHSRFYIIIGGYMRHTGSSISSPSWQDHVAGSVYGVEVISASLSNSCTLGVAGRTQDTYSTTQDCTNLSTSNTSAAKGIYDYTGGTGSGATMWEFVFGSGRGASSHPVAGDDMTFRVHASATVDGSAVSIKHDIIINFVT